MWNKDNDKCRINKEKSMNVETTKRRLLKYLDYKGITQVDFLAETGIKRGFLDADKLERTVGDNFLAIVTATYVDINLHWLITGEGSMLKTDQRSEERFIPEAKADVSSYSMQRFLRDYYSGYNSSLIDKKILAKSIATITTEDVEEVANKLELNYDDLEYGLDIIKNKPIEGKIVPIYNTLTAAGANTVEKSGVRAGWINVGDLLKDSEGALYVYGNSMIPGYPPGSLLGLRVLNELFIEPGSVYVVETESNRYVKRLYYNKDKSALICISDNHIKHTGGPMDGEYLYPPFDIPFSTVKCIYKVTGVIKRNSAIML